MKTQGKDKVHIYCRVKPYVYKYFMKKFHNTKNDAVKLERADEVYTFIRNRLVKPHDWYKRNYEGAKSVRCKLAIEIQDIDFRCSGYELSDNDQRELSTILENRVQKDMLLWVALRYMLGSKLQKTCQEWQSKYDILEEDWQVETMRRMCTRAGLNKIKKDYLAFIDDKLDEIVSHIKS